MVGLVGTRPLTNKVNDERDKAYFDFVELVETFRKQENIHLFSSLND